MIVTTIMIIIIVNGGCIFQNEDSSNNGKLNEYFTAKEGKEMADQKAKDWKNDSILYQVWAHGNYENKNGKSNTWEYDYYSPSTKETNSDGDETYLQYTFNVHFNYVSNGTEFRGKMFDYPFENWNIDSDEAYSIVMNDKNVTDFYLKYPNPSFGMFRLSASKYSYDNHPIWCFTWNGESGNLLTHFEVILDAMTGEIVRVYKF